MRAAFFVSSLLALAAMHANAANLDSSPTPSDAPHVLEQGGGFSSGLLTGLNGTGGFSFTRGGLFLDDSGAYRLNIGVEPSIAGGYSAGIGASLGPPSSDEGTTRYDLRLGAGWMGDRFTVNPMNHSGITELPSPSGDVNLSFTISHALTPSLSLTGAAEARQGVAGNSVFDPLASTHELIIGAGLGLRF